MMKRILLIAAVALQTFNVSAQCKDWKWPEDKSTAEEKNVLYTDALRAKNFKAAQGPHLWLLKNAPDLNTAIYINGDKIYKGLIDAEKDESRKKVLIDSLMTVYDMRMQYCGEQDEVMPRKAYAAYRYKVKQKSELKNILDLFDQAMELKGNNIPYYMLLPYMKVVEYNTTFLKNLDENGILDRYEKITEAIDEQLKKKKNVGKLTEIKSAVDGILVKVVNVDCDFVRSNLGPKFKENPTDLKLAKRIFGFMLNGKCTDDPLWLEAGEVILKNEPDFGIAKALGSKFKAAKEFDKAERYFNMAMGLTDDPGSKADMYIQLGSIKADKGSKSAAREMFTKALSVDPTKREAYTAIGLLYYNSFDQCKGLKDQVVDRSVFLAAYDQFQKAGNTRMMNSAKDAFPSKEEIFTFNYQAGESITVGCWIGVTTTIRSRD